MSLNYHVDDESDKGKFNTLVRNAGRLKLILRGCLELILNEPGYHGALA
ncbi:hypothetical protein LLB_2179 [Legionella longbeachae D-4968]|nr:hypothetical protein LLB_2179 [Legionella longbeachae D-4968]